MPIILFIALWILRGVCRLTEARSFEALECMIKEDLWEKLKRSAPRQRHVVSVSCSRGAIERLLGREEASRGSEG